MELVALAVPFFLLAMLLEVGVDCWRGTGYYTGARLQRARAGGAQHIAHAT